MGQICHECATTTYAVRAAIQRSQASLATLSRELGINPKTVAKWRKRVTVEDLKTGPKAPHSTTLSEAEEAMIVAFRRHTLLPLDDCLYALQSSIPHLTRSALHRCLQRHDISCLPDIEGDKRKRQRFKRYPIGFFHINIAEVQTAEGTLYLFVGIDRTSKFPVTQLADKADKPAGKKGDLGRLIGRTKSGMNTKLHAVADANGQPLRFFMTAGRVSDYTGAAALLDDMPKAQWLLGDRGYDADWFRDALTSQRHPALHPRPAITQRAGQIRQAPLSATKPH